MNDELGKLMDRTAALSDSQLVELLRNQADYKNEAIAIAEEEAESRGGLELLIKRLGLEQYQVKEKSETPLGNRRHSVPAQNVEEVFRRRFVCCKCQEKRAQVRRIATTGTGLTMLLDLQMNHFLAVSCRRCGHTELYDLDLFEGSDDLVTILDVLFG